MATGTQTLTAATATVVARGSHSSPSYVVIHNGSGAALFLGGATVDNTTGYSLADGGSLQVTLVPGDVLYAYSVAGGSVSTLSSP